MIDELGGRVAVLEAENARAEAPVGDELDQLVEATVVGLALQEAAPTHGLNYAPESGRETGASRASSGAFTAYNDPGAAP